MRLTVRSLCVLVVFSCFVFPESTHLALSAARPGYGALRNS